MIGGINASGLLSGLLGTQKKDGTTAAATDSGFDIAALTGVSGDTGTDSADATSTDGMDADTKSALDMLHDMTSGGVEGYFKYMVKQAREKAMADMGVTDQSLAAMDPAQRAAVEKKIEDAVKKEVAKIMGVDPDTAGKMVTQADKTSTVATTTVGTATKADAGSAYKDGGASGSAAEMLSELLD